MSHALIRLRIYNDCTVKHLPPMKEGIDHARFTVAKLAIFKNYMKMVLFTKSGHIQAFLNY